ncbi:MAG: response regulator [Terriglobales bacterium]
MKTKFETVSLQELRRRGLMGDSLRTKRGAAKRRLHVLVVDDERVIADSLVAILSREGFSASAAYSGEAAMVVARKSKPDVLISDICMKQMDGVQLAKHMRELWPSCRTVLISGSPASYQVMHSVAELGEQFHFLTKPIEPRDLIGLLSTWVATQPRSCGRSNRRFEQQRVQRCN